MMTEKMLSLVTCAILMTIWAGPVFLASAEASGSGPGTSPADKAGGVSMRVLWTVSGYVFGKNPSWGEQEAKAFLFKPLDIKENEIVFSGQVCKDVTFQKETVDAAEYLADVWQTTPRTLGLDEQKLQVIRTNCDIPGFQEYMRLRDRRLIVPIKGVFFFFEPAVNY
jgi:hypothetical protein